MHLIYYISIVLLFTNNCRKNTTPTTSASIGNFVMNFVTALAKTRATTNANTNATTRTAAPTPLEASELLSPVERQQQKVKTSKKKGKALPTCRFEPDDHMRTWLETQNNQKNCAKCEWCKYESAVAKREGEPLPRKTPVKTIKHCTYCGPNYRLCPDHIDIWHKQS